MIRSTLVGFVAVIAAFAPSQLLAQCTLAWQPFGSSPGSAGIVTDVLVRANGELCVTGPTGVHRWDGVAWSTLGSAAPLRLFERGNGDLLAASVPGTSAGTHTLARWDGITWQPFGLGLNHFTHTVIELTNGDLVAGGRFTLAVGAGAVGRVARWDGAVWHAVGAGTNGDVNALALLPNGDLIAAGYFSMAGGAPAHNIARWDGSAWHALGTGPALDIVSDVLVTGANELLVGGHMTSWTTGATLVQRWDGSAWHPVGPTWPGWTSVESMLFAPNGDLLVGAFSAGPGGIHGGVLRWNGTTWTSLSPTPPNIGDHFDGLVAMPDGSVAVGGTFPSAGGVAVPGIVRLAPTCAATAIVAGPGCAGAGANLFAPMTQPWTGTVFRARSTTVAPGSLVAAVAGFTPVIVPLASVLPPSPATCLLLVQPDFVQGIVATGGVVDTDIVIPNLPALGGLNLHRQLVVLEFDAVGTFVQTTVTNRISATIGVF
jgi:hypothetical protein